MPTALRLARDTVRAIVWAIDEAEAIVLEQVMRATDPVGPLEQAMLESPTMVSLVEELERTDLLVYIETRTLPKLADRSLARSR